MQTGMSRRRVAATWFAIPALVGLAAALFVPVTYTARSLLLTGAAPERAGAMLPEVPGALLLPATAPPDAVRELLSRSGPPRVVVVGVQDSTAARAAGRLGRLLSAYAAIAEDAGRRVAQTQADIAAADQSLDGLQQQAAATGWAGANQRVADLAHQRDEAEQQASAAAAASKAALGLLAEQPGQVLEFREDAAAPSDEAARALLLALLVEREHLVAQYATGYPAVREVDGKIAAVRNTLAAEARSPRVRVREARNPAIDRPKGQAGAALVAAAAANARLGVIQAQMAEARAQAARAGSGQPRIAALQRARLALGEAGRQQRRALDALPPLVPLGVPVVDTIDRTAQRATGVAGVLLGLLAAGMALLGPRLHLHRWPEQQPILRRRSAAPSARLGGAPASLPGPDPATRFVRAPAHGVAVR